MTDLEKMTDEQLADWQGGWRENTGKFILAVYGRLRLRNGLVGIFGLTRIKDAAVYSDLYCDPFFSRCP